MRINPELLWDAPLDAVRDGETFRLWYVSRVLSRGGLPDLQALGLDEIRRGVAGATLPRAVREFWTWYLGLGDDDGHPDGGAAHLH